MDIKKNFESKLEQKKYAFLAIFLISFLVFWTSYLNQNFFWDDERFIFLNPSVLQAKSWMSFWNFNSPFFKSWPLGYSFFWFLIKHSPMDSLSFYKSLNIFFHALNAYLVLRILKIFNFPHPFLLSLIFLLHPLHVETVSWIFQLLTIVSFSFFLLSFLFLLRFIHKKNLAFIFVAFIFFTFSLWTKSISLLSPFLFVAIFMISEAKKKYYLFMVPFFLMSFYVGIINIHGTSLALSQQKNNSIDKTGPLVNFIHNGMENIYSPPLQKIQADNDTIFYDFLFDSNKKIPDVKIDRIQVFSQAPWHYFSKVLIPINLQFIYPNINYHILLNGTAIFLLFILPFILAYSCRDKIWILIPVMSFVFLLPYCGVTKIAFFYWSNVSDRYTYYFILTLVFALGIFLKNKKSKHVKNILITYCIFLSIFNLNYGFKFNTPRRLYEEIIQYKKNPILYSLLFEQYLLKLDVVNAQKTLDEERAIFPYNSQLETDIIRLNSLRSFTK